MTTKNPAAFPVMHLTDGKWTARPLEEFQGMNLRDYFAAAAMQSYLISSPRANSEGIADWSYQVADAMLAERAKEQKP